MKLKIIDWEIEKENLEEFWGYDYRYYLEEIIEEYDDSKVKAKIILYTNDFNSIIVKTSKLILEERCDNITFVNNESLRYHIKNFV